MIQPGGPGTVFIVTGTHAYLNPNTALPFSVTIKDQFGGATTATANALVLVPLTGALAPGSDSGISNADGITNDATPTFFGNAEPGGEVVLLAAPLSSPTSMTQIGQTNANSSGQWSISVASPLADGAYAISAEVVGSSTINQSIAVMPTASAPPLVIDTAGPVVSSVIFNTAAHQLQITLNSGPGGLNPASLTNAANFLLGTPAGARLKNIAATGLTVVQTSPYQATVDVTYALPRKVKAGVYVVTINATGVTDRAGNILVEKNLVTFPQISNSPNPNYVGEIKVARNGAASQPIQYVSAAERAAANRFANTVNGGPVKLRRK